MPFEVQIKPNEGVPPVYRSLNDGKFNIHSLGKGDLTINLVPAIPMHRPGPEPKSSISEFPVPTAFANTSSIAKMATGEASASEELRGIYGFFPLRDRVSSYEVFFRTLQQTSGNDQVQRESTACAIRSRPSNIRLRGQPKLKRR